MDLFSTSRRRALLFALLYFCEGAPIGFIWWALPAQVRAAGIEVDRITAVTSVLVIPWALKFLWAPLVDAARTRRWSLRSWIITMQIVMGLSLIPLLWIDPAGHLPLLLPLLLIHTVSAATQDVAIDALCIGSVDPSEFGSVNGWMQVGMLLGRSFFGGVTLVAAATIGSHAMIVALIAVLWSVAFLMLFVKVPSRHDDLDDTRSSLWPVMREVIRRPSTWYGLLFAVVGGTAYEGVGAVAGPFFIDRGFSTAEVGFFFSVPSVVGMMAGAVIGGWLAKRLGAPRAVAWATLSVVSLVLSLSISDATGLHVMLFPLMSILYCAIGIFTSSSYALFMSITDPRIAGTQFSTFMGGTNMCESWSTYAVGVLAVRFGYAPAFAVLAVISLFSVLLVQKMRR